MKKQFTLIFCFLTSIVGVFAQNFTLDWFIHNDFGSSSSSSTSAAVHDQNGNIYVMASVMTGQDLNFGLPYTTSPVTGMVIVKYSSSGQLIWSKYMEDGNGNDIALGNDGILYFCGSYTDTATIDTFDLYGSGYYNAYVARMDTLGNVLNVRTFVGDPIFFTSLDLDAANNVHIVGALDGNANLDAVSLTAIGYVGDALVVKFNSNLDVLWAHNYGIYGYQPAVGRDIQVDAVGNVYIVGDYDDEIDIGAFNLLFEDIFVATLNSSGTVINAFDFGGSGYENCEGMEMDSNGDLYMLLRASNNPSFGPINFTGYGDGDIYLVKGNGAGVFSWAKHIGSSDDDFPHNIHIDENDIIYITGEFSYPLNLEGSVYIPAGYQTDLFMVSYNTAGSAQWVKHLGQGINGGGSSGALIKNSNDMLTLIGGANGTFDFDPGPGLGLSSKLSGQAGFTMANYFASNGNYDTVLVSNLSGSGYDQSNSVAFKNNSIWITGYFAGHTSFNPSGADSLRNPIGSRDVFIARYDTNSQLTWVKQAGGILNDEGNAIAVDNSENVFVTGTFSAKGDFDNLVVLANDTSDIFLAKYNSTGNVQWVKKISGSGGEQVYGVATDAGGNVLVTGQFTNTCLFDTTLVVSAGGTDIFLAKYNSSGNLLWVKTAGGTGNDLSADVVTNNTSEIYITGSFESTADFDTNTVVSSGLKDVFVAKYDANGNNIWVRKAGSSGDDNGRGIIIDPSDQYVCVTGDFTGNALFGLVSLSSSGMSDVFIAKYEPLFGSVSWAKKEGGTQNDSGSDITADNIGNIYTTGYYNGNASFGTYNITSFGISAEIFFCKTNASDGSFMGINKAGSTSYNDMEENIAVDPNQHLYLSGFVHGYSIFNQIIVSTGDPNLYLARYDVSCSLPNLPANTTPVANTTPCLNMPTTLTATGAGTLSWYTAATGGTYMGSGNSFTTPPITGTTTFYVQDSSTCGASFGRIPIQVIPDALPSTTISGPSGPVCYGTFVLLSASGSWDFEWSTGGPNSTTGFTAFTSGSYFVIATNYEGCVDTATYYLTVFPHTIVSLDLSDIDTMCATYAPEDLIYGIPSGGTYSGPGVISGIFHPIYSSLGLNTITYAYTDTNGCSGSAQDNIFVTMCLGLETANEDFGVYPNPTAGILNIIVPNQAELTIYDNAGRIVFTALINGGTSSVDIAFLENGSYLLVVKDASSTWSKKIIKID